MPRIRMRIDVAGTFHNVDAGVKRGDIVDVDDATALRYIGLGYAEPVAESAEESAVLQPQTESAVAKRRGRGRPRKQPDWHEEAPGWSEVEQQQ